MADPIMLICSITGCTDEEARKAMEATEDAIAAIDLIMPTGEVPSGQKYISKPKAFCVREKTEAEETLSNIRKTMETLDAEVDSNRVTSNQNADLPPGETHTLHEGTALQSNCVQQCLLPSVEEEVETPETESQ
jgi:hypothetical protein